MTPLLRESVYSARTLAALAESRRQAEARDRAARASATTCGWCAQPITNGTTCCGSEPWRKTAA